MKQFIFSALILACLLPLKSIAAFSSSSQQDTIALNEPAPEFSLKDMNGNIVSLSSFKGKVVVLDFWATWCIPCHENFPAMQKVVNHYKSDKNVVFLFIDTKEKSADYVRLAKEDMKKNNYSFRVIFDEHGDDGLQNKFFKIFGMWGVPTQFIVDSKGIIRYKLVGYYGGLTDEQRVAELTKQVERVKASS